MSNVYLKLSEGELFDNGGNLITLKLITKAFGGDMPNIPFKTLGGSLWGDTFAHIGE